MSELAINIKTEILKKFENLILDEIVLFCKIDRYKDKMTDAIYRYLTDKLYLLCREEFDHMTKDYFIERDKEHYDTKSRRDMFVPHRSWFFGMRNKAAKLIDKKVEQEASKFFEAFKALLEETEVNDLSEEAALINGATILDKALPMTTLQACDEILEYIQHEPPAPQKKDTRGVDPNSDKKTKTPKTGKEQVK